jgi:hypothetical protein
VDSRNLIWSAADWIIACISKEAGKGLFKADDTFDATKYVSRCSDPASGTYNWWYKPFLVEQDLATWTPATNVNIFNTRDGAKWIYMPEDFFPGGTPLRARFFVQVMDPNGFLNINDWLDDCNPTQCQMAHMFMDNLGHRPFSEHHYRGLNRALDPGDDSKFFLSSDKDAANYYNLWPRALMRYESAQKAVSRTMRWTLPSASNAGTPWHTTNTIYFGLQPLEEYSVFKSHVQYGLPQTAGEVGTTVVKYAYSDPDTGRCPLNVNTCHNSGEQVPDSYYSNSRVYPLEAVFNVESLRRIVRIGMYEAPDGTIYDLSDPAVYVSLNTANKRRVEIARTRLAHQYQETLVRYFCARYDHPTPRGPELTFVDDLTAAQAPTLSTQQHMLYRSYNITANGNYVSTYTPILGAAEAGKIVDYCKKNDNSETRFAFGLEDFRQRVKADLLRMCENNRNVTGKNNNATPWPVYTGPSADGVGYVGVDKKLNLEILPGKLDCRTAAAIFDNIVPGKKYLFDPDANELESRFNASAHVYTQDQKNETYDPLRYLYNERIGRDERFAIANEMDVLGHLPPLKYVNYKGEKVTEDNYGKEITGSSVPYRQLVFGPDWFSTELTTTTTNFVVIVHTQMVEPNGNYANPRVLTEHVVQLYVELAPDVLVETPNGYDGSAYPNAGDPATCGLGYYRGGWPAHYKTAAPSSSDSMDFNDANLFNSVDPTKLPTKVTRKTSLPMEWVDFRGVKPLDRTNFYRQDGPGTGNQTKRRVIIRYLGDQNQGQHDGYSL